MAALNSTVVLVPAQKYVLILTDANARTGKKGEGDEEAGSRVLGAYGRNVYSKKGKLLLGFAEDNVVAFLNIFFCTSKSGVAYTSQSANRSKRQSSLDHTLTKQADYRLTRCIYARRPSLETPESDLTISYTRTCVSHTGPQNNGERGTVPRKHRRRLTSGG